MKNLELTKAIITKANNQLVMIVLPSEEALNWQDFKYKLQKLELKEQQEILAKRFSVFLNCYVSPLRCPLMTGQKNTIQVFFHDQLLNSKLAVLLSPTITISISCVDLLKFCQQYPNQVTKVGSQKDFSCIYKKNKSE